jgi:hypothetical protein
VRSGCGTKPQRLRARLLPSGARFRLRRHLAACPLAAIDAPRPRERDAAGRDALPRAQRLRLRGPRERASACAATWRRVPWLLSTHRALGSATRRAGTRCLVRSGCGFMPQCRLADGAAGCGPDVFVEQRRLVTLGCATFVCRCVVCWAPSEVSLSTHRRRVIDDPAVGLCRIRTDSPTSSPFDVSPG